MINPTPVSGKRTPYSQKSRSSLPKSIAAPASKQRQGFQWKRIFFFSFFLLVSSSGLYTYSQFTKLTNSVIVDHEGDKSSILGYSDGELDPALFKKAGDGRFNIVIVGIGGANHPGGNLTDSIQVASVDTINKKIGITSVPRDLYVKIPNSSSYSKINAIYSAGEQEAKGQGPVYLRQAVGEVLGVSISNFVLIDFEGAKQLVDALGGIQVDVPKAIYDPLYPDARQIGYSPFSIRAGLQKMDGATALKYSRSRETTSDFDRSARQQLVIAAIKDKALSLGTLSNPTKISSMIDALGSHVKTDMQMSELRRFINIYKDISEEHTSTFVLDTSTQLGLLTSSSGTSAGYISYPSAGQGEFSEIHQWFQKNNPDPIIAKEGATVTVVAGTGATTRQVETLVTALQDYGYNASVGTQTYSKTTSRGTTLIFDTTKGKKPISSNYLSSYFDNAVERGDPLGSGSDFEIIYSPTASTRK